MGYSLPIHDLQGLSLAGSLARIMYKAPSYYLTAVGIGCEETLEA